ncbi:MAG: hypothetical protein PHG06_00570 [Parabacteroides sp.]|nr:hypothetical protein [Parabacteroides sp.]
MKMTIKPDLHSAVLRNEKSNITGQFWFETVDVEQLGNMKRKVSFIQNGALFCYIIVDDVEFKKPILDTESGESD